MNRTWNQTRSETTHARLQANPEEWAQYHTLYRDARKDWAVVPYEEMIRWCRQRSVEDKWKFTHIRALKTERRPREDRTVWF